MLKLTPEEAWEGKGFPPVFKGPSVEPVGKSARHGGLVYVAWPLRNDKGFVQILRAWGRDGLDFEVCVAGLIDRDPGSKGGCTLIMAWDNFNSVAILIVERKAWLLFRDGHEHSRGQDAAVRRPLRLFCKKNPPSFIGRRALDWALLSEDALQVYEAWSVGCGVEVGAPGGLAPSFWIAVTRIEAGGGAFASNDEIDVARSAAFWRARGELCSNSSHDGPPVSGRSEAGRPSDRKSEPIDRVRSRAERLPR